MLNVSFEFPLREGVGNLPDTHDIRNADKTVLFAVYHKHYVTWRGSAVKETKAYPTIRRPNNDANRGLPKSERLRAMRNAER